MEALIVVIVVYFVPAMVGYARGKRNATAIFMMNLLLGWTVVGWVMALVWALTLDEPTGRI